MQVPFVDYYKLLELQKECSPSEIKKAFRSAAHKYHPDKNSNDPTCEAIFKTIVEAYEILLNPELKKKYDKEWDIFNKNFREVPENRSPDAKNKVSFGSFLKDLFSDSEDESENEITKVFYNLNLTIRESFCGTKKTITYLRKNIGKPNKSKVNIVIPPYSKNGDKIKIPGAGHIISKTKVGDLIINLIIKKNKFISVKEDDIHLIYPANYPEKFFGAKVKLPKLFDEVEFEIPKRYSKEKEIKVKGKGFKNPFSHKFGDLIVHVVDAYPENLTKSEIDSLKFLDFRESSYPLRDEFVKFMNGFKIF